MLRQRCALNRPWRLRRMKLFWYRKSWKQSSITAACRAPVPSGDLERNGRRYHILIEENHRTIEGVEMREVSCTVTDKTGTSFLLSCFWRRHEAERVHFMEVLLALLLLSALAAAVFRFSGRRREPWHLWTGGGGQ